MFVTLPKPRKVGNGTAGRYWDCQTEWIWREICWYWGFWSDPPGRVTLSENHAQVPLSGRSSHKCSHPKYLEDWKDFPPKEVSFPSEMPNLNSWLKSLRWVLGGLSQLSILLLTLAQVMISGCVSLSPTSGSALTVGACLGFSLSPLSLPLPLCTCECTHSLKINKVKKKSLWFGIEFNGRDSTSLLLCSLLKASSYRNKNQNYGSKVVISWCLYVAF